MYYNYIVPTDQLQNKKEMYKCIQLYFVVNVMSVFENIIF